MSCLIESVQQLTAERVTAILRRKGVLPCGQAMSVSPTEAKTTFASKIWSLALTYSSDTPVDAPNRLFLKCSNPTLVQGEFDPGQLLREIDFYQRLAPMMDAPFLIPCYDVCWEEETGASHILLKDVSDTHMACDSPANPSNCELAVDVLAQQHTFWWDHPCLGKDIGQIVAPEKRRQNLKRSVKVTEEFMAAAGEQLQPSWRTHYECVLSVLPDLFKRHETGRNLTLAHGDAHLGNFLFPREGMSGSAYLLDWQFWHPTIGGTDLAFLMAVDWKPATRRRLEKRLLRRYYQTLIAQGVRDYSWENCWDDYRLSVILVSMFIPVWRWSLFGWGIDAEALEHAMSAFEDLGCVELL